MEGRAKMTQAHVQMRSDPGSISVVLAEPRAMVREGLAALLRATPGVRIAGECSDGATAVDLIMSHQPDFAFLDLDLPKLHAIQAIRNLRRAKCASKLIVLSPGRREKLVEEEHIAKEALQAGADGYLLKEGPSRHLADAISQVMDGGIYISPLLRTDRVVVGAGRKAWGHLSSLSPREHQVVALLAEGMRPKEIAGLVQISPKTVDAHKTNAMRKLGVHNLADLLRLVITRRLVSD